MWASIFAVILCLAVLVTGGMATTAASLAAPDAVLFYALLHRQAGEFLGAALIAVLAWTAFAQPKARALAGILCLAAGLQGVLGAVPLGAEAAVVHACLAQMLLAGTVALAVSLSRAWAEPPQIIRDYGWPSLRSFSLFLPVLVTTQVGLGAAFRHRMLGLMPHIIGAMLVSLIILITGSFVLQQCKDHKTLAGMGRATMVFTFVQVFLGLAVFTVRSMPPDATVILVVATSHVTTGAALLACCVVLGMFVRKNVIPKNTPTP